jgi:hypothetical protein
VKPDRLRRCQHCNLYLPPGRFINPRVRICERCDGPPLIIPTPSPFSSPGQG